jgi:methylase of polypeptide subunit release factors
VDALLSPAGIEQLRTALSNAGYTSAGIAERIGPQASAAAARGDVRAALRATTRPPPASATRPEGGDPLATLIRVFVCGQAEPEAAVAAALAPLPLADALAAGLVEPYGDGLRQGVDLEAYGEDWWVVSDVTAAESASWGRFRQASSAGRPDEPLRPDHVLGIGGASTTLAGATIRRPVGSALDLGTGCGVQALHLSTHAGAVTATDVSPRALRFAATTAALSGQRWELLGGDLAAPVAGRRFDLVVSNPPFVVGEGRVRHAYRDSGRAGDGLAAELAAAAPGLLTEGGVMQYLANWAHVTGEDWGDRVAGWVAGTGLDAWVIQREVADPVTYVNMWLSDANEPGERAAAWLDWFDAQKIEAVGFGLVTLRRSGHDDPVVRVEDLRQQVEPPFGEQVAAWFDRQDWLRGVDLAGMLDARYRAADGLQLRQEATMGEDGWAVDRQVLAMPHGLRWVEEVDPLVLALVGGGNGEARLRDQLTLLAAAHEVAEADLAEAAVPVVAHLVERGILVPCEP